MRGVPPPENATTAVFQLIAGPGANLTLFRLTTGLRPYRPAAFAPTQQLSHTWLGQCQPSIRPGASHVSLLRQNTPPLTPDRRPGLHLTPAVAGFSAARDSKAARLLAPFLQHDGQTRKVMAVCLLPRCDLNGRNYWLELYSDLNRLPHRVPTLPGFPSAP